MEQLLLAAAAGPLRRPACASRPSTASRRACASTSTVNEFTRDLWADRELEVFGEQFWRPYVHVRDAARAVRTVLDAPAEKVGATSSTSATRARTTASSIWSRRSGKQIPRGKVSYVRREEDPRDYKVSFDKISAGSASRR